MVCFWAFPVDWKIYTTKLFISGYDVIVLHLCIIPEFPPVTTTSLFDGPNVFGTVPAKLEANGSSPRAKRYRMVSKRTSYTVMFETSKLP